MGNSTKDYEWEEYWPGWVKNCQPNVEQMKELLNSTGPGFCLAKWNQVTIHLGTGLTHSCHHPIPHKIPLDEVLKNPHALHNTSYKKKQRKEMLCGNKPAECDYCWRIEDKDQLSDRFYKSLEPWSFDDHDTITKYTGDEDVIPKYVEVSFGNTCNQKCIYCGPEFSSKWAEELKREGIFKLLKDTPKADENEYFSWIDLDNFLYKNNENNPYIDAYWKWFPEVYKEIKYYRITGGEPLLQKETFKTIDFLIDNPNPNLDFSINSNLSCPDELWDKFLNKILKLIENKSIKKFTLYSSIESYGPQAEYARYGLDFEKFKTRAEQYLRTVSNARIVFMSTFNILALPTFYNILEWVNSLKRNFNYCHNYRRLKLDANVNFDQDHVAIKEQNPDIPVVVGIDIPYLRGPEFLDCKIATPELIDTYLKPCMDYIYANKEHQEWNAHLGFEEYEASKLRRIYWDLVYTIHQQQQNPHIVTQRAVFYDYNNEIDRRRNTNFLETFPEFDEFFSVCKKARENV